MGFINHKVGNIKEQIISFETAKLAKEKGFNEPCLECYVERGTLYNNNIERIKFTNKQLLTTNYSAPTQSLLQRWLREIHNIDINIEPVAAGYGFYIHKNGDYIHNRESYGVSRNTYEEALEIGLQEGLKLIKL